MAGDEAAARWIAKKLNDDGHFSAVNSNGSGFLEIARKDHAPFTAAAIGVKDIVTLDHVVPLFELQARRPEFVVNVPSKVIWSGTAIDRIHDAPAAFGTYGEMIRASSEETVYTYRNKEFSYFEQVFQQHSATREVKRLYDRSFQLHRFGGLSDITVVLVEAYDVSAEDIRNARQLYGSFDAAVKTTSYGSITTAAREAAESMGADVFKLSDFKRRLNNP